MAVSEGDGEGAATATLLTGVSATTGGVFSDVGAGSSCLSATSTSGAKTLAPLMASAWDEGSAGATGSAGVLGLGAGALPSQRAVCR